MPVKYVGAYKQVKIKASSVTFFNIVISELNYIVREKKGFIFSLYWLSFALSTGQRLLKDTVTHQWQTEH